MLVSLQLWGNGGVDDDADLAPWCCKWMDWSLWMDGSLGEVKYVDGNVKKQTIRWHLNKVG